MAPPRFASEGNSDVVCSILSKIANNQTSYRDGIKRNHALTRAAAQRLTWMQENIQLFEAVMDKEELKKFMEEKQATILQLAEANVQRERHVQKFVAALEKTQGDVQRHAVPNNDYQSIIDKYMKQNDNTQVEVHQEKYWRDVAETLGIGQEGGDEDIAVVQTSAASASLKCPITGTLYEDPVKNKLCGHVYSKQGIANHIKFSRECPIAGCNNKQLKMTDMEEDLEMAMLVKKEHRRLDREKQIQASQASDLVDSDEDE